MLFQEFQLVLMTFWKTAQPHPSVVVCVRSATNCQQGFEMTQE